MAAPFTLSRRLAEVLPRGIAIRAYHLSTPPTKSSVIFSAGPGQPEDATFCESHFLTIAVPKSDTHGELLILALEVLVFTTPALITVFVSKADSTGYGSLIRVPQGCPSITRSVVEVFISYLLEPRLVEPRVVLSLFARAQDQYLFPGSIENAEKHVLDDRQLIKWWCRVLDAVWRPLSLQSARQEITAHVVVPGTEKGETRAFFPPSSREDAAHASRWSNDYPAKLLAVDDSLPPRCLIPRLPDDPKARFLNDLDSDYIGPDGHWRSVKTVDQFWEFMAYRQECSAGRQVGFIWVTFVRPREIEKAGGEIATSASFASQIQDETILPTPADSQTRPSDARPPPSTLSDGLEKLQRPQSPPPSFPPLVPLDQFDPTRKPQHCTASEEVGDQAVAPTHAEETPILPPVDIRWPASTRGQIVADVAIYDELIEVMLRLDFTGQDLAAESTNKWTTSVQGRTQTSEFGVDIVGLAAPSTSTDPATSDSVPTKQPTMLMGVRKKRKPEDASSQGQVGPSAPAANVLSAGLVRKKPKTGETA